MLIGDRTFTLLMFMLHMDMHGASSIVPHAALWHLGFDFHLSLESGACQIDSSAVSHRCIRRVQRERNMQNGMITILGDARLRSGYLPHAKRAIYQLIYIPDVFGSWYMPCIMHGPRPHWGTVRKKMSPGKVCKSCVLLLVLVLVLRSIYTVYIMIIISRSLSRWHSFGSISNASTT